MVRYKPDSYDQGKFIPIHFTQQIPPSTFEYSLNHLFDHKFNLSLFAPRFSNDQTDATAYGPKILLKIMSYLRGIASSQKVEQACR